MILDLSPISIEVKYPNRVISVEFDGGYVQKRNRHTRSKKEFKVSYVLDELEAATLTSLYETVGLVEPFTWKNYDDLKDYTVQFKTPLVVPKTAKTNASIEITLEEV